MRSFEWTTAVAAIAVLTAPTAASAKPAPHGAEATVRAYVAALRAHDARRACGLLDESLELARTSCVKDLTAEGRVTKIARARVSGTFARGTRARVLVDLVYAGTAVVRPIALRDRVLLRRRAAGWRIVATTELAGGRLPAHDAVDPVPRATGAALRRLADDELLVISGNGDMLCGLLAPGAPLSGPLGGCHRVATTSVDDPRQSARIARYRAHLTGATHARLDVTVVATRASRLARKPGYQLRSRRWQATVFAARAGGRWRLAKPSRSLYQGLGIPEPSDVDVPTATATWPQAAVPRPSISERATPAACATPPAVWGLRCSGLDDAAFAARPGGGGLIAWTTAFRSFVRPVVAGLPAAPVSGLADLPPISAEDDALWVVDGIAPVADGALLLEVDQATGASVVVPVDADGRPRGAPQTLSRGSGDPEDVVAPVAIPAPPGGPARVLVDGVTVRRLGADGRPAGPAVTLRDRSGGDLLVGRADGGLTAVRTDYAEGVAVVGLGADGRASGVQVQQAPSSPHTQVTAATPVAAVDADGHALVAWVEEDRRGTAVVRAWVMDPADPADAAATAPVTVATFPVGVRGYATFDPFDPGRAALSAAAMPGGGWALAWTHAHGAGNDGLTVARLNPDGTATGPPVRVAPLPGTTSYGEGVPFGLAGDAIAWVEPLPRVGLTQVRAAPLP